MAALSASKEEVEPAELSLYRRILLWNYYQMWSTLEAGESFGFDEDQKPLPLTFKDVEEYVAAFEALMLGEFAAVMLRGLEETVLLTPEKCITGPVEEVDDFLIVQFLLEQPHAHYFRHNDLILLTSEEPSDKSSNEALNALGMMEAPVNENSLSIRFYLKTDSLAAHPADACRIQAVDTRLRIFGSGWWLTCITSLTTSIREWNAIHSVKNVRFQEALFSARASQQAASPPLKIPEALEDAMAERYNDSQMKALSAGLSGQQMVLIQGPPGTGKTNTLLGLLSVIMYAMPAGSLGLKKIRTAKSQSLSMEDKTCMWLAGLMKPNPRDLVKPWDAGSREDDFGMAVTKAPYRVGAANKPTVRVLVCAPSNSALDEIVLRLLGGISDRKGRTFFPSIVRVGLSVHHSVQSVALDALVDKKLARLAPIKTKQEREKVKLEVIEAAHIVCSTLSFSGSSQLKQTSKPFDVVVIDEAAQAVEPSTLIPLCTGAKQVYLIGDPIQLPATVISREAISYKYDMSMFKRLQSAGYPVNMLDTQYRMHPSISAYPSAEFYHGNVRNGPGVKEVTMRPWHKHKFLGPFAFYDVRGTEKTPQGSSSLENLLEAQLILRLYVSMVTAYPELKQQGGFAVISPYLAQVQLMKKSFINILGADAIKNLDINTIDGFQGREKEVVFFSAVRSSRKGHVGFVADERRINVGLTRARCSLVVVGNASALEHSSRWHNLLRHARLNRCFFRPSLPYEHYVEKAFKGKVYSDGPTPSDLKEIAEAQSRVQADRAEEDAYSDEEFAPIVNAAVQTRANEPDEAEAHKRSAEPPTSTRPGKRPRKAKDATAPSS